MKGWCVTCQLRTGNPTLLNLSMLDEPCPYALPDDSPHLVHVYLPVMYTPSRPVTILDISKT